MFFLTVITICNYVCLPSAKGRTIRKVMGGRGGEQSTKCEKIHTQRVAQKKSSCIRKKYIYSYKGNVNKKIRAARKSPHPPPPPTSITFLMVRP